MIKKLSFTDSDIEKFLLTFISQHKDMAQIGFSICVQHEKKINFKKSFGLSRKESSVTVENETLFSASSLAKAFTAAAFLMKAREHKEILTQPLVNYIKDLAFIDGNLNSKITLSDLLSHRVGWPSHDLLWMLGNPERSLLFEKIRDIELIPDSYQKVFSYNNIVYGVLEIIFEKMFHEKLMEFIFNKILKPLQMRNTFFKEEDIQKNPHTASPYHQDQLLKRRNMDPLRAAGGLWTCIEDLSKWMMAFEESFSDLVLTKSEREKMFAPQISFPGPLPFISNGLEWMGKDLSYGLGWFIAKPQGQKIYFHPGIIDGYTALIVLLPEFRLRLGILTNSHLSPMPGLLVEKLLSSLCQKDFSYPIGQQEVVVTGEPVKKQEEVSLSLLDCVGTYSDKVYGDLEIIHENQKSFLKYKHKTYELKWTSNTEALFSLSVMELQLPMSVTFQLAQQKVVGLQIPFSLDPRVNPQVFKKN